MAAIPGGEAVAARITVASVLTRGSRRFVARRLWARLPSCGFPQENALMNAPIGIGPDLSKVDKPGSTG